MMFSRLKIAFGIALIIAMNHVRASESAPDTPDRKWVCEFCTYASGWLGTFEIGPGYSSIADLKFADYRGIEDKGSFLSLYGETHFRDQHGRYFDVYARDLGTESRQLEMRGGVAGRYEIHFDYREIPKYRGFGTTSPYQGMGSDRLTLPANWEFASSTAGMSTLDSSLSGTQLKTLRKDFDAGLRMKLSGSWRYDVTLKHMEKNGSRPFAAGVFTIQSSFLPAPVDFSTDRLEMGLEYTGKKARMRLGFTGSWFSNANASLTWDNPFNPIGNTQVLQTALEPDSNFQQFNFTGAYQASTSVRVSASAALSRIQQDSSFLPYSINPDFENLQLPRASLDQRVDSNTLNLGSRLSARLSRKLKLTARIRIDERDNQTPVLGFTPVITDLVPRTETVNRPYSFKRERLSADLSYRLSKSTNILSGLKRLDYKRSLQSVRETQDTTFWGAVSFNGWMASQLRMRVETSQRDISPYQQVSDTGLQENVLMRKFNLSGRDRRRAVIELDLSPKDNFSVSVSIDRADDDYDQSVLGLLKSKENSANLDFGYSVNQKTNLHLFISRDDLDSTISGAGSALATPWHAVTQDRFTTIGAGLTGQLNDRIGFSVNVISSRSNGRIKTATGQQQSGFPELETELRNARVSMNFRVNRKLSWMLVAEHENYSSTDWQIDGLGNDGINAILTFGANSPDYSATLLRLMANFRF
jgi:MtrB/PioB family decaheme-associated outer membrane protein